MARHIVFLYALPGSLVHGFPYPSTVSTVSKNVSGE
jgi:hypothetical protein